MRWLAVALLALGACGGSDNTPQATTTGPTSTAADCLGGFNIPLDEPAGEDCREGYLAAAADSEGVELTGDAYGQAEAICREIGVAGLVEAVTLATLGWGDGSRPSPADDREGFVALAVGIYCPEHFDELRELR